MKPSTIRHLAAVAIFFGCLMANIPLTHAAIPQTIGYEGYVTDAQGAAQTGSQSIRIRMYDALTSGTLLFDEIHSAVPFTDGSFSIAIGAGTYQGGSAASFANLAFHTPAYLSLEITSLSTGEMSPRTPLNAVPYAYTAQGIIAQAMNPSANLNAGEIYFNTASGTPRIYDGTSWLPLAMENNSTTLAIGQNATTLTIGNTTGTTVLRLESGTGAILLQVAGTGVTGNVQVGEGGSGSATPDLLVLDQKNTSGDPTGTSGALYYNASTGKFRCFQNSAWTDCIGASGAIALQHAAAYDTSEEMTNIPTGGTQVVLGTISVTPASTGADVYVSGWADVYSSNGTDQPLRLTVETTENCTGSTVGNADVTYTITSAAGQANVKGVLRVAGIVTNPGVSAQPYSLCAAVTSGDGDTDIMSWGMEALVIDSL